MKASEASLDQLRLLHERHLLAVPFENLDILLGVPIVLNHASMAAKIVERLRGGFCYELNGTFSLLLRSLGYRVTYMNAQVAKADGGFGRPYDHLALSVECPHAMGRYLVDVGFGDSFRFPLPLEDGASSEEGSHVYRLTSRPNGYVLERRVNDRGFEPLYRFATREEKLVAFEPGCRYHQASAESSFTQRLLCTIAEPSGGRFTLTDSRLIQTSREGRAETNLGGSLAFVELLVERFGFSRDQAERCRPLFEPARARDEAETP